MNPTKLLAAIFGLTCLVSSAIARTDYIQQRGGCPNTFARLVEGSPEAPRVMVAFLGGSIAAGRGASAPARTYREMLIAHLRREFPATTIARNNAAVEDSGSWLGAFRLRTDVFQGSPALLLVDFAVDDEASSEERVLAALEGIVRQAIARSPTVDIVFVYPLARGHLPAYRAGKIPETIAWHERVAEYYGIPSINLGAFVADKILSGELTWDDFSKDDRHPTDRGHALLVEALGPFFARGHANASSQGATVRRTLPIRTLAPAPMDKARCVPYEWAKLDAGWRVGQRSPSERFMHVLECDRPGPLLTLKFTGSQIGCYEIGGPHTGALEFSIDGGPWQLRTNFEPGGDADPRPRMHMLATDLPPKVAHSLRLRVADTIPGGSSGRLVRIGWLLVDGEVEDPCARADPLARIDAVYAAMKPIQYSPPPLPERWRHLERTMARLQHGPEMRIVMLGDSIIGDTSSSRYELLLQRLYPKCTIIKQTSVRGSTGCWWYRHDNRVEEYVLQYRPDLLIIGGISQRGDLESIREVIRQVRAKQSPEILLMTPAFGALGDRHIQEWTFEIDRNKGDYRAQLARLAEEEKCGYLDLTGPWWRYVQESGCDYGWFQRDRVHANERGFQILGRIIEQFFTP